MIIVSVRRRLVVASSVFSLAMLFGFFNIYWVAALGIDITLIALFASEAVPERVARTVTTE
jgi:hypothetical protein